MALQSTTAIAAITLQQASSTVTFSGIPNTYRDLILCVSMSSGNNGNGVVILRLNGDTANMSRVYSLGEGTSTYTYSNSGDGAFLSLSNINTTPDTAVATIFDYAQTDKHKAVIARGSTRGTDVVFMEAARWASLSPVSNLTITHTGTNIFAAGNTFSLYGRIA